MSDYGQFQMFIYEVPDANVEAVLDLLIERGLDIEWNEGIIYERDDKGEYVYEGDPPTMKYHRATEEETRDVLKSVFDGSDQITDQQARLDIVDDLSASLAKLDVVFQMSQDPVYEYMGVGARNHPRIGLKTYDADADGQEYIATFRIRDIIEKYPVEVGQDPNDTIIAMANILTEIKEAANVAHALEFDRLVKESVSK